MLLPVFKLSVIVIALVVAAGTHCHSLLMRATPLGAMLRRCCSCRASTSEAATPSTSNSQRLATVTYRGKLFQVPVGTKLRTALLRGGSVSPHNGQAQLINCRGIGSCGTCAVEIRGPVSPNQWTTAESLRLNFPPHKAPDNERLRLACQVAVEGDIEVIKRNMFWGQGDQVLGDAGPADFSLPLGQLEFIMDRGGVHDSQSNSKH